LDRLSFEVLFVPPLRERKRDILLLAHHFAARMAFELEREEVPHFSQDAVAALERYHWPGNIRELKNVIERAVYRSDEALITQADIIVNPFHSPFQTPVAAEARLEKQSHEPVLANPVLPAELENRPFPQAVQELEIALIRKALTATKYNQRKAAQSLGLSYHQFRGLCRKYGDAVKE
jgi:psp operon transcriptional activator